MARRAVITILDQLVEKIIQLHSERKEDEIEYLRFTKEMVAEVNDRRDKTCPPFSPFIKEFVFQGYRAVVVETKPGVVLKWYYYHADPCAGFTVAQPTPLLPAYNPEDNCLPIETKKVYFPRPSQRRWCGAFCAKSEELRIVVIWT
jgi:hypothetical protein